MDRIYDPTAVSARPARPSTAGAVKGFRQERNPPAGLAGTIIRGYYEDDLQESLMAIIEGAGLAGDATNDALLRQAIIRLRGGQTRAITGPATPTLTADDSGSILVDATAGNVTITLPPSAALNGINGQVARRTPIVFEINRRDSSANTVTIVATAGGDIDGASSYSVPAMQQLSVTSNAIASWVKRVYFAQTGFLYRGLYTSAGSFTVPAGRTIVRLSATGGGGSGGGASSGPSAGAGGGGGGFMEATFNCLPGEVINFVIGNGAGSNGINAGVTGGSSVITFASGATRTITATGGAGGQAGTGGFATFSAAGGSATQTGAITAVGIAGTGSGLGYQITTGSIVGGVGGGSSGTFGGGITPQSNNANGLNAQSYGAGGGGGGCPSGGGNMSGGAGATGYVMVEW